MASVSAKSTALKRSDRRIEFETSQKNATQERLEALQNRASKAEAQIAKLQDTRSEIRSELDSLQARIDRHQQRLKDANAKHEGAVGHVDDLRERARKAQRSLDKAVKEIAAINDEIERLASSRHVIYRKCRLDNIDLPLVEGRLDDVPVEEVCLSAYAKLTPRARMPMTTWR